MLPGQSNQMQQMAGGQEQRAALQLDIVLHNLRRQRENPGCAGPDYTLICECCKKAFQAMPKLSGQQRTSYEYEVLRKVLFITDHNAMPVFCDPCYERAIVPGFQRQMSYPNLVLAHAAHQAGE